MDLDKENSGLESVLDNEVLAKNGNLVSGDDVLSKIENNGTGEGEHVSVETVKDSELGDLMPVMVTRGSDSGSPLVSPGTVKKGKGLRKWRRIKRDGIKEGNLNVDNSKFLKRGLSNAGVQPGKTAPLSSEMRQISEGSVSSSNEVLRNPGALLDGFGIIDGSGLVMAPVFAAGAVSENKEDSLSTAANVPKMRDGRPVIAGHVHDRNRAKSYSGKSSSGSVQKVQDKTMAGTSKKMRAGKVSLEKQNSYSSKESDSRSSNAILVQDNNHVANRGRLNGGSENYAGENGVQAHREANDQFRTSYGSNNGTEFEDVSQIEMSAGSSQGVEEEKREKQETSTDQDPLIASIHMLQSVQEALEEEVQKFKEIGNEDILATESRPSDWTYVNLEVNDQSSSGEDNCHRSLHDLESEVSSMKENAHLLKIKLEETTDLLNRKEADISELEARLGSRSTKEDMERVFLHDHVDVGAELESIFRGKIEAEVQYLTISKTIQDLRVASVDKISILEQQIASDKSQILKSAEKLESYREDVCPDETVKLQSNVCKYTLCFLLQLILLIVVLGLLSQPSPRSTEVVPT
ncbi:hypothetical protein LIER_38777 [Lithospermum erythrorhizon]|uniref:Uncharacterized protein n=1 Tax=Lithospermum erythrorhizon TaxID=34254 RepID=A0AAV3Q653_LITER